MGIEVDKEFKVLERIGCINRAIIDQTSLVQSGSKKAYTIDYITKAFIYLANTLIRDDETADMVRAIEDKQKRLEVYHQRLNLYNCIVNGVGVCRQFATLLSFVIANDHSGLTRLGIDTKCEIINCKVVLRDGGTDLHTLCCFTIDGQKLYCDISRAVACKDVMQKFCLVTKDELQQAYYTYDDGSHIEGRVAKFKVEQNDILSLFNCLECFCDKHSTDIPVTFADF